MNTSAYIGIGLGLFIAFLIIGMAIYIYVIMKDHSVICPQCKHVWKPKIYKVIFTIHFFDSVLLKCPSCCTRGMVSIKEDAELKKMLNEVSEEVKEKENINIEQ